MKPALALIATAFVSLGCESIAPPAGSRAPANACGPETPCAGYPADAGVECLPTETSSACQTRDVSYFVLVVSIPAASGPLGGTTYAISRDQIFSPDNNNSCADYSSYIGNLCFRLAPLQGAYGGYLIDDAQAHQAARNLGNTLPDDSITLPVAVTFFPQWTPPDTPTLRGSPTDARLLNLPLPPIYAIVGPDAAPDFGFAVGAVPPGDDGKVPIDWVAALPPSVSAPGYSAVVNVSSPFDDGYPDVSYPVTIVGRDAALSTNYATQVGLGASFAPIPPAPSFLPVQRADGKPFEGTWTVYYRDPATLQALTSRPNLTGGAQSLRLNQISTQPVNPTTAQLVMEPPAGMVMPTLVNPYVNGLLGQVYPAIPPIAHVSGQVQAADGEAVSATLLFFSKEIDDVATCEGKSVSGVSTLVYQATVHTADQIERGGGVGRFDLDLPQGRYGVIVQPTTASGYAKSTSRDIQIGGLGHAACSGPSPTIGGLTVLATPPIALSGTVVTADGRPLANATVELTPAAALAPGRRVPLTALASAATPEDLWPRAFRVTTGAEGGFSVEVDPYGPYDMTVRPEDGTNFPWIVRPDFELDSSQQLEPLVVPAPFLLDLTLDDPSQNPLAGAVIQAFAFTGGVAVPIGDALADSNGHFTMMLSGAFAAN